MSTLQGWHAGGTGAPPGPAHENIGRQKALKGNGVGPRQAREVRRTRAQPQRSEDRTDEAPTECSHVGLCGKDTAEAQNQWWRLGGRERQRRAQKPFKMARKQSSYCVTPRTLTSRSLQHRSGPGTQDVYCPSWPPWGPPLGACAHRHQHPEPQLAWENTLPPPPRPSCATCCAQLPPLGTQGTSLPGDAAGHRSQGRTPHEARPVRS